MKKLLSLSIIATFAGMLFTSCKSSLTITKRQHNRGYYIASNRTNKFDFKTKSEENATAGRESATKHNKAENPAGIIPKPVLQQVQHTSTDVADKNSTSEKPVLVQESKNATPDTKSLSAFRNTLKGKTEIAKNGVQQLKEPVSTIKKMNAPAGGEGRSLLWILVVVLLILWLLGLISGGWGLGLFIHVLLVIAVVLLILWLLGIV